MLCRCFPVDDGSIILDDQDITRLPEYERAKFMGQVFQDPMMGTAPSMTIEENLSMACCRTTTRGLRWGLNEKTERVQK